MKNKVFVGGGCNSASLSASLAMAAYSPSKQTLPAGATWPFVSLRFNPSSIVFQMAHIRKEVLPSEVTHVSLNKMGYLLFTTSNHQNDFGFVSPRLKTIIDELKARDYKLDDTVMDNLLVARLSLALQIGIPLAVVLLVTILSILKPHGL